MADPILSRRTFLAATGLGTAAVLVGCAAPSVNHPPVYPTVNPTSPLLPGPYQTARVILGETTGTQGMPQPFTLGDIHVPYDYVVCQQGVAVHRHALPTRIKAAVYYPYFGGTDHRVPTPNPLNVIEGPFPVLLYAHDARTNMFGCVTPPTDSDFTSVDVMLRHVASYGCVCVVPDLSWLADVDGSDILRPQALGAYYLYLDALNESLFAHQMDLSRVILVGHGQGTLWCWKAGMDLTTAIGGPPVAYGFLAPGLSPVFFMQYNLHNIHNAVVLGGTLDSPAAADPQSTYSSCGEPKTLATITGANHWGYTSLCMMDNTCKDVVTTYDDPQGTILRTAQQQTGAAYLAALVRYYALGDNTARPYLSGAQQVEGLERYNVTDIQVQSKGLKPVVGPTPLPTAGTQP